MKNKIRPFLLLLLAVFQILICASSRAATIIWTNSTGGSWSDATNWKPNQVPGASDNARITNSGTFTVLLDVDASVNILTLGGLSGQQTLNDPGQLLTIAGTSTVNTNGVLTFGPSGSINATGQLRIDGGFNMVEAAAATGSIRVNTNGVFRITGSSHHDIPNLTLTNLGTVVWSGGLIRGGGNETFIYNFGLWDAQSDDGLSGTDYGGSGILFSNRGVFRKSIGVGATTIQSGVTFINSGIVDVQVSSLSFVAGAVFLNGCQFTGAGVSYLTDGIFTVSGSIQSSNLVQIGGTMTGTNTIAGLFVWQGGLWSAGKTTLAPGSTVQVTSAANHDLPDLTLTNYGTVAWSEGAIRGGLSGSTIYNYGTWNAQGDHDLNASDYGGNGIQFVNFGTFLKSAGVLPSATQFLPGAFFDNRGTVNVGQGGIALRGGGTDSGTVITTPGTAFDLDSAFTLNQGSRFSGTGANFNAGTLSGTWTGTLNWLGGFVVGNLVIPTNGVLNIAGVGDHDFPESTLTNFGTVVWAAGRIRGGGNQPGTLIYNYGTWDAQCDQVMNDDYQLNPSAFFNFGLFLKSAGTNAPGTELQTGVNFNNTGILDVRAGVVTLSGGGEGAGQFIAEAGSALNIAGGYIIDSGAVLNGAGTNIISGGNFTLDSVTTAPNTIMTGGNLQGTNGTINGSFTWLGGTWNGAVITIASNAVVTLAGNLDHDLASTILTNYGTVVWAGGNQRGGGGLPGTLIYNYGTWDVQCDQAMNDDYQLNPTIFSNLGLFLKSAGTNSLGTEFQTSVYFNNSGDLEVRAGAVTIAGTGKGSGQFIADAGATMNFASSYDIGPGATFSGAGTNVLTAGTLQSTNGIIYGNFTWLSGDWSGQVLTIATNSVVTILGDGVHDWPATTVTNYGTVLWNGGLMRGGGNLPGTLIYNYGTWDVQCDQAMNDDYQLNPTIFSNFGTFLKSVGTNSAGTEFQANVTLENLGTLDVQAGLVSLEGGYDLSGGSLNFGLGGVTNFGRIHLIGDPATLGGTVSANFENGYLPRVNDSFSVISYVSATGSFTNSALPYFIQWQTNYAPTSFDLTVLQLTAVLLWTNPAAITYGTPLSSIQLNATPVVPGTITYLPPAGTRLNAGNNTLSAVFHPTDTVTYHSITSQVSIAVSRVPLAIVANSFTRQYGQFDPVFTGTVSGVINGDNLTAAYSCTATLTSAPGSYPITGILIDPNNRAGNYNLTSTPGALTIVPGPAPTLAGISTNAGPTTGGTSITLIGANFESRATVTFGSATPVPATILDPSTATVLSPALPPGAVTVTLNNPDGTSVTASQLFTYGIAPAIQTGPADQSISVGSNAQFHVVATGGGTLVYQWLFAGSTLPESGHAAGTRTATLNLNNVSATDIGLYQVSVSSPFGQAISSTATLNLLLPPTITVQPQSQSVGLGAAVNFAVAADGTAPLTYQWRQNNALLPGATNALLTIASAQTANAGAYTVVITNVAGSVTSAPASLTLLNYCASAQVARPFYPMNVPVPITVHTIDCSTTAPAPNLAVVVWVFNSGASQTVTATTDNSGNAVALFTPLPGEVGVCQFGVALPGQGAPVPTGSFTLAGLAVGPATITARLVQGFPQTFTVNLTNLTLVGLSGIQASAPDRPANVGVHFVNVPPVLSGGNVASVSFTMSNTDISIAQQQFHIQFATAEGVTNLLTVNATMTSLSPLLAAAPENLVGTMIGGGQSLVSFTLTNQGAADSGPLQIQIPVAPWLSLVTTNLIASLPPGQSSQVTLALTPAANLPLGPYAGTIEVTATNLQLAVPFNFTCVSTLKGNLQVSVEDELSIFGSGAPNVSNAVVTITDFQTGTNVAAAVTDASGIVLFTNLTSAYYSVAVEAPNHGSFSSSLLVQPNQTNLVTAFLSLQLVSYVWTVVPTQIPDQYDFVLTTVFQTKVPWPVVTVSPGTVNLCRLAGDSNQVDLVITNSGLIAAQDLKLVFGSNADWSIKPLINDFGDLAGNSAITVPVIITRIGSDNTVAGNIAAEVDWSVTTPTQGTIYNATPIYVYNANPDNCHSVPVVVLSGVGGSGGGGGFGGGGGGGGSGGGGGFSPSQPVVSQPSYTLQTNSGAIVSVTLQIDQTAVISRNAFKATLQLNNGAGAGITDLSVTLNPVDAGNHAAPGAFFIQPPALNNLNAVDGTGTMAVGASGTVSWTIIPTTNAAPNGTTIYGIGGTLAYKLGGRQVTIPLFAVPITVLPDPRLIVDYFLQHDVYSDDPFTPQTEPSIPFGLGIMMRNSGLGVANAVTITSSQPTIIANSNGLIISFELIGSQAGTNQSVSPSLTLDLGDIGPNTNSIGVWLMTCSLEGSFISYDASFKHTDALGGTDTSLVDSVRIHEMNHIVRVTTPFDDGIPDFLVNDTTNVDALPGKVYSSDGSISPVTSATNAFTTGTPTVAVPTATLTLPSPPAGFVYLEVADPGAGAFVISSVRRSDGTELLVGPDAWQTPERDDMVPPQPRNLIHLFDRASTGTYTVTYAPIPGAPSVTTLAAVVNSASSATLNAQVDPNGEPTTVYFVWGATTNYGNITPATTLTLGLNSPQSVQQVITGLLPGTTVHFQAVAANSLGTVYALDQAFSVAPLPPAVTTLPASAITVASATLNATVTPEGASTSVYFQWGATTNYGQVTGTNLLSANLNTAQAVGIPIGYPSKTTNHFRAVAYNNFGLVLGSDMIIVPLPTATAITNSAHQVVVSWPTNYPGFTLQSATNLVTPVTWTTVPIIPTISGANYTVTNQMTLKRMFYQLRQ